MGRFSKLETHKPDADASTQGSAQEKPEERHGAEPVTYDETMRAADAALYGGEWSLAMRLYSRALQIDNAHVEPWAGQVLALVLQEHVTEADAWSRRGVECFPDHPTLTSLRGLVYAMQGMTKRAIASSDYAIGLGRADALCWVVRGWILLQAKNTNWQSCFAKAAEMCPPDGWRLHALMALALDRYKKWPRALDAYKEAIDQQTGNAFLWSRLARCYEKLGLPRKAREATEHVLAIDPDRLSARSDLHRQSSLSPMSLLRRLAKVFR